MRFKLSPLLFGLVLSLPFVAEAATYYVSPTGNDTNAGTSQGAPWRTITRVNQIGSSLQPGDKILFQRDGLYRGKLTISSNGTAAAKIEVGAYGTGALPVISGSIAVSGWTVHNGNIWRAQVGQALKHVFVNGQVMQMARFPNTGWLRVDQGTSTSLTDAALNQANGYWNGATAVIRTTNWSYDTAYVTNFSNGVLTHTSTGNNLQSYNWGYFLQNKLALLDAPGEWYYDSASGYLYLQCPGNADPNSVLVEVSVLDNGIYLSYQRHDVKVTGVELRHQTDAALRLSVTTQVEVADCVFSDTWQAIKSTGSNQNFHHNTVQRTFATAVFLLDDNSTFANNTVMDVALIPGLGENNWGYIGLRCTGSNVVVSDNRFTDIGYIAMVIERNSLVERNVVTRALVTLNDGGGIAFDNADGMIIRNNIVRDLSGNIESSAPNYSSYIPMCHGIYFGNISIKNTRVEKNTVSNCLGSGIHVDHTMVSSGNRIEDNVLFNNTIQLSISDFSNCNGPGATAPYHVPAFNDVYNGNVLYCLGKDQLCMRQYHVNGANWVDYGTFTNNRYFNPYNDRSIFLHNTYSGTVKYFTLERWQADRNEDLNSTRSPLYLPDMDVSEVFGGTTVPNGSFNSNVNGWSGWPTQGQLTHNTTKLDGGALKVNFTNNATYNTFGLKHDTNVPVQSGSWYRMRFSIVSDMMGEVLVGFKGLSQVSGPQMEGSRYIPFDANRRDVTLFFQSSITDQGYCSFTNSYLEGLYYLDNVELDRVTVTPIDPFAKQQLFTNDLATAQDFSLTGCWSDVLGAYHTGSITVPPYSSVVLVKEEDGACMSTGAEEQGPSTTNGAAVVAYPNPVQAGSELRFHSGAEVRNVTLFDPAGKLVLSTRMQGSASLAVPGELDPGTYFLRVQEGGGTAFQALLVQ